MIRDRGGKKKRTDDGLYIRRRNAQHPFLSHHGVRKGEKKKKKETAFALKGKETAITSWRTDCRKRVVGEGFTGVPRPIFNSSRQHSEKRGKREEISWCFPSVLVNLRKKKKGEKGKENHFFARPTRPNKEEGGKKRGKRTIAFCKLQGREGRGRLGPLPPTRKREKKKEKGRM